MFFRTVARPMRLDVPVRGDVPVRERFALLIEEITIVSWR
jgi:hypothetical protein